MLKFKAKPKQHDITNEVAFEGTLLRNGIMSLSDELKFATDYDKFLRDNSDSMFDENKSMLEKETLTSYSQNLEENILLGDCDYYSVDNKILEEDLRPPVVEKVKKKILKPIKIVEPELELTHQDANCDYDFVNNTCLCFYKTSTPVRVEFDPYEEIFPAPAPPPASQQLIRKVLKLQTTEDNLQEMRDSEEMLADALAVSVMSNHQGSCSPRVKQSLKKIGKHSKRGALTVFTSVLSSIV